MRIFGGWESPWGRYRWTCTVYRIGSSHKPLVFCHQWWPFRQTYGPCPTWFKRSCCACVILKIDMTILKDHLHLMLLKSLLYFQVFINQSRKTGWIMISLPFLFFLNLVLYPIIKLSNCIIMIIHQSFKWPHYCLPYNKILLFYLNRFKYSTSTVYCLIKATFMY